MLRFAYAIVLVLMSAPMVAAQSSNAVQKVSHSNAVAGSQSAAVQREAIEQQDKRITAAARQVAALIDERRAGEVWDGASTVAKASIKRDAFVNGVTSDRQRLGDLISRGQASVSRIQYEGGTTVPEGLYLNVSFASRFGDSAQTVRELVSFRLDDDQIWRVSGYSVRSGGQ